MTAWFRRLRARLRYRGFDADLAREIDTHRAMKQAELESAGLSAAHARDGAARALGNVFYMREEARGVWVRPWLDGVWRDLRYAGRGFAHEPLFSAGAILVLALGVGSLTIAFSFLNAALLRPWQVRDPGSIVVLNARTGPQLASRNLSLAELQYFQAQTRTLSGLAAYTRGREQLGQDGPRVSTCFVTSSFFDVLQVRMKMGRGFTPADGRDSPATVAVISERVWRNQFDRDPAIVGRTVHIKNRPFEIIGVAETGFQGIDPIQIGVWLPLSAFRVLNGGAADNPILVQWVFGRMKAGIGRAEARAELGGLSRQFREAVPMPSYGLDVADTRPINAPGGGQRQDLLRAFALIFAGLGLVLLLTCSNVGSLLLARAIARQREVAVRLCLGADWKRVARQFFTETLVLSLGAGGLGLAILSGGSTLLADKGLGLHTEYFAPDVLVFLFSLVVCMLAAAMASGVTVLYIARFDIGGAAARRHGPDVRTARARGALLAVQIAVSTVLLTGAGLLSRAALQAASSDPGFAVEDVRTVRIQSPAISAQRRATVAADFQREVQRQQIPNVAFASDPPLLDFPTTTVSVRHPHEPAGTRRVFSHRRVSANYFEVLDIALVAGRVPLAASEGREVVVNSHTARMLWPDTTAIGRELVSQTADQGTTTLTVVGVAEDVPISTLGRIEPVVYSVGFGAEVLARHLSPETLERLRAIAIDLEPSLQVVAQSLRDDIAADAVAKTAAVRRVAWMVGGAALCLAMVGAFGLFAYTVEERRREIGIRLALGGKARQVTVHVLRTVLRPSLVGVGLGFLASAVAALALRSTVYGLEPFDPVAYLQVAGLLAAATALAAFIPAFRAGRVDPSITLRCD